jgi:hypothetical protein
VCPAQPKAAGFEITGHCQQKLDACGIDALHLRRIQFDRITGRCKGGEKIGFEGVDLGDTEL